LAFQKRKLTRNERGRATIVGTNQEKSSGDAEEPRFPRDVPGRSWLRVCHIGVDFGLLY